MPKYTPSFIDYGAVAKVYSDELYRRNVLYQKRQEALDKKFESEYKMYSGKIRQQDIKDFESDFSEYKYHGMGYSKANKSSNGDVTTQGQNVQTAHNTMMNTFSQSVDWAGYGKGLLKYKTDTKYMVNRDKYDEMVNDLSYMSSKQLNEKYGGVEKAPKFTDFEFSPQNFNVDAFRTTIKHGLHFDPAKDMKMDAVDDQGKPIKMTMTFNILGQDKPFEVNAKRVSLNPNPYDVLKMVTLASYGNNETYVSWYKDKMIKDAQNVNDPASQKTAQDILGYASKIYNTPVEQLTAHQVYASTYMDPTKMAQYVDIPDYKDLNEKMKIEANALQQRKQYLAMKKLQKDMQAQGVEISLKTMPKLLGIAKTAQEIGVTGEETWNNALKGLFSGFNLKFDDPAINKMAEKRKTSARNLATGGN